MICRLQHNCIIYLIELTYVFAILVKIVVIYIQRRKAMVKKKTLQRYLVVPIVATAILVSPLLPGTEVGTVSADSIYTVGSSGSSITTLQTDLSKNGFKTDVDGIFGPDTKKAVMDFQKSKGLKVDGIAGKDTLDALNKKADKENNVSKNALYKKGDRGSKIKKLQSDLGKHGFSVATDSIFGQDTYNAVRSFQKSKNLQVDGIAGKDTLHALSKKASSEDKSENDSSDKTSNSSLYRKGDRGSGVKDLQTNLGKNGYNISADGIFGQATYDAVRSFQKKQGLQVDGIAGKATLHALNGKDNSIDSPDTTGDVVSIAEGLIGKPYVFGGTTPSGFDSSGFINYVFKQKGINLDRTHDAMWANNGKKVSNPSPGDVVFFENTYKSGVSHSGIYIGNNKMIHAGTEKTGVEVTSMSIDYWNDKYIGAKSMH